MRLLMSAPALSSAMSASAASPAAPVTPQAALTAGSTQTISGRLVHTSGDPAGRQEVQLVSPGCFWDLVVDSTKTNKDGTFKFTRRISRCPLLCCSPQENFLLRVLEEVPQVVNCCGGVKQENRVVDNVGVKIADDQNEVSLGDHFIDLYGYQKNLPALLQPANSSRRPQQWTTLDLLRLAKAGFSAIFDEVAVTALKIQDLEHIQRIFHAPANPELRLTGEDTIEMLLNGIHPAYFQKTAERDVYAVEINWDRYQQHAEKPILVNTTLKVKKTGDKLEVVSVSIQGRGEAERTYTPNDAGFSRALYVFNSMAGVKGQAHFHLGRGHFVTEQNAMAAFKFLNRNSFKQLVTPHLRGVLEIDRLGSKAIFGDDASVLVRSTGLTSEGLYDVLKDTLAATCYTTFKPKAPFAENDRFARAGNLFWDIINDAVEEFFKNNQDNILENWIEIYYMSKSLVENSLPYRPLEGKSYTVWADGNEIDNPDAPGRMKVENELRAMRPITRSKDAPQQDDLDRLKQFARFAIYTATFWHWVVHASQGKWMTNFRFGSLALNKDGAPDNYGNTAPEHMNQILALSKLLMNFNEGSITANENRDIYAGITERLKAKRQEFARLGFDIDKCFYGTII